MIKLTTSGSFKNMDNFLQRMKSRQQYAVLAKYGPMGVSALSGATPKESAQTAGSWSFEIVEKTGYYAIHWSNSHIEEPGSVNVAVILQYGHGTGNGGYIQGRDYINPAMRPIFDQIVADMWREVTR